MLRKEKVMAVGKPIGGNCTHEGSAYTVMLVLVQAMARLTSAMWSGHDAPPTPGMVDSLTVRAARWVG